MAWWAVSHGIPLVFVAKYHIPSFKYVIGSCSMIKNYRLCATATGTDYDNEGD